MLLKFFAVNGGHDEPGGIVYLLANPTARVVRGDPEFTKWVIDHSPTGLRQRFSAGVISDLTRLDRRHDDKLLDELQKLVLAGRPESAMVWCVIEHTDKGKRELHFVIVLFDLLFAKLVHPYIDRIDRHGFSAWVEYVALRHGLEITSEKLRIRPPFEHLRIRRCEIEFLTEVWGKVHGWVQAGDVACRHDLEIHLAREGYCVRFRTRKGKPLQQPVIIGPDEKKLRLKNSIYYCSEFGSPCVKPIDRTDPQAVKARIAELRQIIINRMDFRAHHLIGRLFGVREQRLVALGKARQRFKELLDRKLEAGRHADQLWHRIDLNRIWKEVELNQSKKTSAICEPEKEAVSAPGLAKRETVEAPLNAPIGIVESPAFPNDTTAAPAAVIAEPEAGQPPPSVEITATAAPSQGPPKTPARPAKSRISKQCSPSLEINGP